MVINTNEIVNKINGILLKYNITNLYLKAMNTMISKKKKFNLLIDVK